jgi:hypothetical protein
LIRTINIECWKNTDIPCSHGGEYEDDCLLGCCAVAWQRFTDVLEVLAASIISAWHTHRPDDGGGKHL